MLQLVVYCARQHRGQNNCPKHVELTGIINKPLLLHLVGCLYYLYQWSTFKQISDNEIYFLMKYIKSFLWRVAKRLSYIENARCLKVKPKFWSLGAVQLSLFLPVWWISDWMVSKNGNKGKAYVITMQGVHSCEQFLHFKFRTTWQILTEQVL